MKIDKQYLFNNRNKEENTCKICVETPWNQTNITGVYAAVDKALPEELAELGLAVLEYKPISYDRETDTFILEVVICLEGVEFEEEE